MKDFQVCTEFLTLIFQNFPIGNFQSATGKKGYFLALGMRPYFGPELSRKGTSNYSSAGMAKQGFKGQRTKWEKDRRKEGKTKSRNTQMKIKTWKIKT